jgi:hypothetical protein
MLHTGTLHAIGAGTFVHEIEQPSDLTFRISDWGCPTGRQLHRAEALRAVDPSRHAVPAGSGFRLDGGALEVPQFRLELPDVTAGAVRRDPGGRSLEIITTLRSELRLAGDGWTERLWRPRDAGRAGIGRGLYDRRRSRRDRRGRAAAVAHRGRSSWTVNRPAVERCGAGTIRSPGERNRADTPRSGSVADRLATETAQQRTVQPPGGWLPSPVPTRSRRPAA